MKVINIILMLILCPGIFPLTCGGLMIADWYHDNTTQCTGIYNVQKYCSKYTMYYDGVPEEHEKCEDMKYLIGSKCHKVKFGKGNFGSAGGNYYSHPITWEKEK